MAPSPTTIFLHIAKTAGSSISRIVTSQFASDEIYQVVLPHEARTKVLAATAGSIDEFAALDDDKKRSFRCIIGHMNFGLHRVVPQPCRYLTFLRDPVERVLSAYFHQQRRVRLDTGDTTATLQLDRFLAERPGNINHQTRMLVGSKFTGWSIANRSAEEIRSQVRTNLTQHFALLGTVERFLDSLALMECELGWSGIEYRQANVGNRPRSRDDFAEAQLDSLEATQELDKEVVQFANRWMDERIAHHGERFFSARRRIESGTAPSP